MSGTGPDLGGSFDLAPNILLIPGTRTRAHLAEDLGAADARLDAVARAELAGAGIVVDGGMKVW
jgi:hypothetical protein